MAPLLLYCGVPGYEFPLTRQVLLEGQIKSVEGLEQMGGGAGTTAGYLIKQKKFVIMYCKEIQSRGFGKITFLNIDMGFVVAQAPTKCCFGSEKRDYIFLLSTKDKAGQMNCNKM